MNLALTFVISGLVAVGIMLAITVWNDLQSRQRHTVPMFVPDMSDDQAAERYSRITGNIRATALMLLVYGGLETAGDIALMMRGAPLYIPSGLLAIAIGLLALRFKEPATIGAGGVIFLLLFVDFALDGDTLFTLLKITTAAVLVVLHFQYVYARGLIRRYEVIPEAVRPPEIEQRTGGFFPGVALAMGVLTLVAFGAALLITGSLETLVNAAVIVFAVSAVAFGWISLREWYPRKAFASIGLICGMIPLALELYVVAARLLPTSAPWSG